MKYVLITALLSASMSAAAYVPTVEALFRHGANPEVSTNALSLSVKLTPVNPYAEKDEAPGKPLWVKWVYNVTAQGKLKLTQLVYRGPAMNESVLADKTYVADLNPSSFTTATAERGLFFALLNSTLINDGSFMVDLLKQLGLSARHNEELINHEKKALLERYRSWLAQNKGGRGSADSPLAPADPDERSKVERLLATPMYHDAKQVFLTRHKGEPAWQAKVDQFEAWVGDADREVRHILFRGGAGEMEIQCVEPTLYNGTHRLPRQILVKTSQDLHYQVDVIGLRHFNESPAEMLARLRATDQYLMHRREALPRPSFIY